jgi:hypothetical protein
MTIEERNDLPNWVAWWVSPPRKPHHSIALLLMVLAMGWLPVFLDWRLFGFDMWWGAGTMSCLACWGLFAILWMVDRQMWR